MKPRIRRDRTYPDLATYIAQTGDTQKRIAHTLGISQAQVSRLVHGSQIPRPELAERLAAYARIPFDSFHRVYLARQRRAAAMPRHPDREARP